MTRLFSSLKTALSSALAATLLLAGAGLAVGVAGAWLFKRLRRTYQLATIGYWLDQMEKCGTHVFPRPTKEQP